MYCIVPYRFTSITKHGVNTIRYMPLRQNSNLNKLKQLLSNRDHIKMEMQVKSDLVRAKFNDMILWYERFTGLAEVRITQQKVLDAQDRFIEVQNKRREIYKQLSDVQTKRKDIHGQLQLTKPGEPKYLQLITDEHNIIGEESKLISTFIEVEKLERELFTSLTTAVRISHERERLQADKTKYWSIIGSIIGTIIGIIGSSINNSHRIREIKQLLEETAVLTKDLVTSNTKVRNNITSAVSAELQPYLKGIENKLKIAVDSTKVSSEQLRDIESKLQKTLDACNKSLQSISYMASQNVTKFLPSNVPSGNILPQAGEPNQELLDKVGILGCCALGFAGLILCSCLCR